MKKDYQNKAVQNSEAKGEEIKTVEVEQEYFFPDYGKTVKAISLEEAMKKIKEEIND